MKNPATIEYIDLMASAIPDITSKWSKNQLIYIRERYIATEIPTPDLQSEVSSFYENQTNLSSLALKLRLKKAPPRIRAFEEELSERLENSA